MSRSGWLTLSAVVLMIAGVMRVIDAVWAFSYRGTLPVDLQHALAGHSLATCGWISIITGVIFLCSGDPGARPSVATKR